MAARFSGEASWKSPCACRIGQWSGCTLNAAIGPPFARFYVSGITLLQPEADPSLPVDTTRPESLNRIVLFGRKAAYGSPFFGWYFTVTSSNQYRIQVIS